MCFSKPGYIAFGRCCRQAAKVKVATGCNALAQITTVCPKERMVKKTQWYNGLNLPYQTSFPYTVINSPQYKAACWYLLHINHVSVYSQGIHDNMGITPCGITFTARRENAEFKPQAQIKF
jgi:hypothetical protein